MDGFTQVNRILAIDTPLGPDQLLLEALEGTEAVSALFNFRATVRAQTDMLDPASLVAQPVDFHLRLQDGVYRSFNGIVAGLTAGHAAGRGQRHYELEIVPWLWLLTRTSDCRIFQNKSSLEILATIFDEMGHSQYDFSMAGSPPPRPYCVQYRETDFAFVCRLLEEDGLYYFFRHEPGKHTLVVATQTAAYQSGAEPSIPFSATSALSNHIKDWRRRHSYQASAWTVADYNFETSKLRLNQTVPTLSNFQQQPQHEHFEFPGLHADPGLGERRAKLNMQAEEVERETIQGVSNCRTLAPIGRFLMTGHPVMAENSSYVVLSVSHKAADQSYETNGGSNTQYENSFTCIPASTPFVPRRTTPRPTIPGLQTAVVVGPKGEDIHTDAYGRVKVQFYWDRRGTADDRSSCWIRATQSWAGRGFGAQTIPRVGMEVVVGFMEGNPDRPVILGLVPNSETAAPVSLPAQKTQTAFRTLSSPGGNGFNLFSMEDKAGGEELAFHSQKDLSTVVQNNQFIQIGNGAIQRAKNLMVFQVGESAIQLTPDKIILVSNGSTIIMDKTGISLDGDYIWLNTKEKVPPPEAEEVQVSGGGSGGGAAAGNGAASGSSATSAIKGQNPAGERTATAKGDAWAANKQTGPVNAKVMGAEGEVTGTLTGDKATVDAKGEAALARISAKGQNSWGEAGAGLDVFAAEANGHAGITKDGLGAAGEAKAAMQRVNVEGALGHLDTGGVGLKGTGELFSADAKGQALLGDDGRYIGAALGGKAGARVAQAQAETNVTIPIGWLPGVPDDWTISGKATGGVSAGTAEIGGGGFGYYDRQTSRYHGGGFAAIGALFGVDIEGEASIGPAPKK
ncbi:type VI secretion system tip protein TssI/VgrG [Niveispirillum sp. BGYR6]|uniref:type VI secretion system Vgr family protein n=1 Tax=Niveispirillum sp. BGYR6 TaxID=2971249 RepID=UPI0022B99DCE|nr:type VI secretion system tip protein TssI/VgrG [Niveispirillum sp. BGYR6]MDG5493421.1 type VI secretion system tip protein TssI/VgrG [Niveispirillum sp. BGYR6]